MYQIVNAPGVAADLTMNEKAEGYAAIGLRGHGLIEHAPQLVAWAARWRVGHDRDFEGRDFEGGNFKGIIL